MPQLGFSFESDGWHLEMPVTLSQLVAGYRN